MNKSTPVSVRLQPALNDQVAAIATALERSKSWVIEQAVKDYVALEEWRMAAVAEGIKDADEGRVIAHEDIVAWVDSLEYARRTTSAEMRIVWTASARFDLSAARAYIALDSPAAALQQVRYVLASIAILARFPLSGRPGRYAGTRELVVSRTPFIVIYRLSEDSVDLLRIFHGRQRWPDSF